MIAMIDEHIILMTLSGSYRIRNRGPYVKSPVDVNFMDNEQKAADIVGKIRMVE